MMRSAGRRWPAAPLLTPLFLATSPSFASWSVSGLETTLFAVLLTLALVLVIREDQAAEGLPLSGFVFALAGIVAMLGYVAVLPFLGYSVSTFLLLLAIMLLAGYRRPVPALLIALLGTFAFFFVFQRIAYISLPLGAGVFKQISITLMALIGVR